MIRRPAAGEIDALARLWHEGWHLAHAAFVPGALVRLRTLDDFRRRLPDLLEDTRVIGAEGVPVGFCTTRGAELYQLFVSRAAQGTGAARELLADGEARIAAARHRTAHLDCLADNARAVRFYSREGWRPRGLADAVVDTADGTFPLRVLVFEKALDAVGSCAEGGGDSPGR